MKNYHDLLIHNIDIFTLALNENKTRRGRQSSEEQVGYGVNKLRHLVLDLAIKGRISEQFESDEPSCQLIQRILLKKGEVLLRQKIKTDCNVASKGVDVPFELPRSWVWATLGDIGWTQTGSTPPKNDPSMFGSEIPFIKPADIYKTHVNYSNEGLSIEGAKTSSRIAKAGSLLMVCIGTIGKCNLIERDCSFNQQINSLTPCLMNPGYLLLALRSNYFQKSAWAKSSSTTIPILNKGKWEKILIPIPPLDEQQRIADRVDELMSLFDRLEALISNASQSHDFLVAAYINQLLKSENLEIFENNWISVLEVFDKLFTSEQSIDLLQEVLYQLAVTGKLSTQNSSDGSVFNLLNSKTSDQGCEEALPNNWIVATLDECALKITDGEHFRPPTEDSGVYFLSAKDIRDEGVSLDSPLYISAETADKALKRCNPEYGDVLIVSRGATVGRTCMVNIHDVFCLLGSVILVKPGRVLGDYLVLALKSPAIKEKLINASGSTAQPAIYLKDLKKIIFPIPPLEEQKRIIEKMKELNNFCDQLKFQISQAGQLKRRLADALVEQALA